MITLFISDGERWHTMRQAANRLMMRPHTVASHTEQLNSVVDDCLVRMAERREGASQVVHDIEELLFNWALECKCNHCTCTVKMESTDYGSVS